MVTALYSQPRAQAQWWFYSCGHTWFKTTKVPPQSPGQIGRTCRYLLPKPTSAVPAKTQEAASEVSWSSQSVRLSFARVSCLVLLLLPVPRERQSRHEVLRCGTAGFLLTGQQSVPTSLTISSSPTLTLCSRASSGSC